MTIDGVLLRRGADLQRPLGDGDTSGAARLKGVVLPFGRIADMTTPLRRRRCGTRWGGTRVWRPVSRGAETLTRFATKRTRRRSGVRENAEDGVDAAGSMRSRASLRRNDARKPWRLSLLWKRDVRGGGGMWGWCLAEPKRSRISLRGGRGAGCWALAAPAARQDGRALQDNAPTTRDALSPSGCLWCSGPCRRGGGRAGSRGRACARDT